MSAAFGRLMQVSALILLPIALSYGLFNDDVQTEVKLLALGGFLFLAGRMLAKDK